jgi:hypothetical protein
MPGQRWSSDLRDQARALYVADGVRLAASVTGIPERTVRQWARSGNWRQDGAGGGQARDQQVAPVTPIGPLPDGPGKRPGSHRGHGWQPRLLLSRLAGELWEVLGELGAARAAGKAREARELGVLLGILTDKCAQLAKDLGHDGGRSDPEVAVARIREMVAVLSERAAADG